jgi:hypothetical protein
MLHLATHAAVATPTAAERAALRTEIAACDTELARLDAEFAECDRAERLLAAALAAIDAYLANED